MGDKKKLVHTKHMDIYYEPGVFGFIFAINTDTYGLTILIGTILFVFT